MFYALPCSFSSLQSLKNVCKVIENVFHDFTLYWVFTARFIVSAFFNANIASFFKRRQVD